MSKTFKKFVGMCFFLVVAIAAMYWSYDTMSFFGEDSLMVVPPPLICMVSFIFAFILGISLVNDLTDTDKYE